MRLPIALRLLRPLAAAALPLVLAACATLPAVTEVERAYAGRFAATTVLGEQRDNVTGRFTLSVAGARLVLDLATPVGTTLARIEHGPEGTTLRTPGDGGQVLRGRDPEALAEQVLGWPLPVAGIGDWIEGRPALGRPSQAFSQGGTIARIEQDGWTIELPERFDNGTPRRLVMARPARDAGSAGAAAPAITLRIVLDDPLPATPAR